MTEQIGIVALAVACGIAVGAIVAGRRRVAATGAADIGAARLEARLEVQAAEMRRLADAAAARDLSGEQLRAGVEGARRALHELAARDQERRAPTPSSAR